MWLLKKGVSCGLVILFLLFPMVVLAENPSPVVNKQEETVGRVTLESKEYPLDHYRMEADIGDGFKEMDDGALHAINQGMWGFNKTIASFTLYSINELMSFDLISSMAGEAGIMSERIYQLMSGAFFSLFIIFIGASAAWRYFVNQQIGHAVKAVLGALMITVATFWFFSNAAGNIQWLNERGSELEGMASSANVLLSSEEFDANEAYNSNEGVAVLENQLFNLMVKRPYLLLNYGSTKESEVVSEDPNRVDKLLEIKPFLEEGKEKRKDIVTDEVKNGNKQMTPEFSGERFGYLIITILSTIALAIPVLLLGAFKFLLQVWFLALVIFTAIPLVLSLIPAYSESALNHGKKLVGVLMMKAGLVLLISVITGLVTLLYESVKVTNGVEGYAFVVFLICLTMWGLFKYRSEIFEVASAGMVQGQQVVERATTKSVDKVGEARQKTARTATRMVGKTYKSFRNHKRYSEMGERISDLKASTGGDETRSDQRVAAGVNGSEKQKLPNHKNVSSSHTGKEGTRSAARNAGSVVHLRDYKKGKAPGSNMNESTGGEKTTLSSPTKRQNVTRQDQSSNTVREPSQHRKQETLKTPGSEKRRRETSQKVQEDRVEKKSSYRKLSKDDRVVSSSEDKHQASVRGNKHTEKQELSPVKRSSRSIQPVSNQRKPPSEKSSMRKETAASKESSKPITKWEAQQQIDQRRFKSSNLTRSRRRKPGEYVLKRRR